MISIERRSRPEFLFCHRLLRFIKGETGFLLMRSIRGESDAGSAALFALASDRKQHLAPAQFRFCMRGPAQPGSSR